MREVWLRRNGPLHHHFRFGDVGFLMLDTQDPPRRCSRCPAQSIPRRERERRPPSTS
jgi:hypothetical protein